ncbi:sugar ABC transporter ATP-binding protein [candidate division KSB1 bacterium]|nr:sugar ABC transporter ATP-binding protein [candidate division KSB1 bacterium]MBL7095973.1 sugar ABC transporter ATP-binding protein [candidate division KSB1 bacterium]
MQKTVLQMKKITKKYPGVTALKNVDFDLREGEVHALVGENGAGKSTLIKILGGAISKTGGEIFLNGDRIDINNPLHSQSLGVAVIYQELMLAPTLSAAENILLGKYPRKWRIFVDRKRVQKRTQALAKMLGMNIDLNKQLSMLTIAQQQMVEVAKALSLDAKIIVMDEPSAVLTTHELEKLFNVLTKLKKKGVSFIYISHRLEEVFKIADRVSVLKDGELQGTRGVFETNRSEIIKMMIGREIKKSVVREKSSEGKKVVLEVKDLKNENFTSPINLKLLKGEILGIAGLVGAGRTELVRAIFGADKITSGKILMNGKHVTIKSPKDAVKKGIGFVPEDRKGQGLLLEMNVRENMTITNLKDVTKFGFLKTGQEKRNASSLVSRLKIRIASLQANIKNLSGGNQQKVILARWLDTKAKVFIFDEPTRGIDIAAKLQIHDLMSMLVSQGASIIMISSELPEILEMSDRIVVMHEGHITGKLKRENASEEIIMNLATA